MKIYNYLRRKLEDFVPIHQDHVGMYVCGPTVYGEPHLGHARSALVFDVLYRYLSYKGYSVRYVRNITDVGHLEDEEHEQGEDKIEKIARLTKIQPMQIAHMYTEKYRQAMYSMNILSPSIEPLASGHIIEQQEYIQALIDTDWAYEVDGNVYFDVKKFADNFEIYGALSGKKIEDLLSGQRELKQQDHKKHNIDFALWKQVNPNQVMHWKSPWTNKGVPGWHTECCVMSQKYLGHPFDIHGGGLDLQFPHHEAEIAQCYALGKEVPAKYWIYNNMITIDNRKMSKSVGNFITLEMFFNGTHERLSRAYSPQEIRFFLLRSHYRNMLDVSDEALQGATKGLARLQSAASIAYNILESAQVTQEAEYEIVGEEAQALNERLVLCMDKDMDTPGLIAELFSSIDYLNTHTHTTEPHVVSYAYVYMLFFSKILGLKLVRSSDVSDNTHTSHAQIDGLVSILLEMRAQARSSKDFALSDKLRDSLLALNIVVKDEKDGSSTWRYKE